MKSTTRQNTKQNPQMPNNRQRPEIRDNLDHREGLEQETKGDDITHNKKETKVHHLKEKKGK
jgi:hypothetical protein